MIFMTIIKENKTTVKHYARRLWSFILGCHIGHPYKGKFA